jgi:ABC-type dipeptide/oligopeptide/nickel transport system ATPase subunit
LKFQQTIRRATTIKRTARLRQLEGLFDVQPAPTEEVAWDVDIELPDDWSVGVIVGDSGSGKTTLARELFGADQVLDLSRAPWTWPADESIVDGFAPLGIKETTGLLSSVGFSSPPAWRRPFGVLSNGQQFRVNLARALAERERPLIDEFGSFVHQQVRLVAAAAAAKTARRLKRQLVAITCHDDCVDYFEPDWVISVQPGQKVTARVTRGLLRRPPIELKIVRTDRSTWARVAAHHYLSHDLHRAAMCFAGLVGGELAAFTAVLPFPHAKRPGWREHRTVCLPDYQGVGRGNRMSEAVASLFAATGKPYFSATSTRR